MSHVDLVDATLRDGQQSLWGMRMQAGMALPVADIIDRTGFRVVDATGSSFMEVLVKYCREDPWEGLDLLRASIHRTPMRAGMRGNACVSFGSVVVSLQPADAATIHAAEASRRKFFVSFRMVFFLLPGPIRRVARRLVPFTRRRRLPRPERRRVP